MNKQKKCLMKKFVIIGICISLFGASIDAQEKKEIKITTPQEKQIEKKKERRIG
jgi:hypothetical protein